MKRRVHILNKSLKSTTLSWHTTWKKLTKALKKLPPTHPLQTSAPANGWRRSTHWHLLTMLNITRKLSRVPSWTVVPPRTTGQLTAPVQTAASLRMVMGEESDYRWAETPARGHGGGAKPRLRRRTGLVKNYFFAGNSSVPSWHWTRVPFAFGFVCSWSEAMLPLSIPAKIEEVRGNKISPHILLPADTN